ncbi:MAG: MotE family protein [Bacillota bacterium]|nr:MotE family protein [Bacillota bacterium]
MDKTIENNDDKKYSPFQWFIYIIFIPLLFAITVALIVFTFAGVNVFESAKDIGKKIPVIGSVFEGSSQKNDAENKRKTIELEGQVEDRDAKITQLQSQMEEKDRNIKLGQLENQRLQQEIDSLNAIQNDNKRAFKDIVSTFESMSAKKAAPIITKMSNTEALKILKNINPEILSAIMQSMDPVQAAKYTEMLTNMNENNPK